MSSISGIYKIVNVINGHKYIGSAKDLRKRKHDHFTALQRGRHHSIYLQRAYNKYGEFCFNFEIINLCDKESLIKNEQRYFDKEKPEYNIVKYAGSQLGYRHTEETKKKISEKKKGSVISLEHRNKLRDALIGRKRPKEVGEKISARNRGRVISPEWRKNLSISHKGHRHTDEHKQKIGMAHLGRKNTLETIKKMSIAVNKRGCKNPYGRKGVGRKENKNGGYYTAYICVNSKDTYLGRFNTIDEAGNAYDAAVKELRS